MTTHRKGTIGDSAMVVSAHPLATAVGAEVLRKGGNAFDAAVAVHYALAVVLPWAGNIGGGGFMVARKADGSSYALDFRERAPGLASRDMFLDPHGRPVPDRSISGHLAVGVPGSVAGLFAMHDSLGRLPMSELIQPAIDLATRGFPLTANEAAELEVNRSRLRDNSTLPSAYLARDVWSTGDTLVLTDLAATLSRIRDQGADGFYAGATADLIVEEMRRGGGLITLADLRSYAPVWRTPLHARYRDLGIITMPPPSAGGVGLIQLLKSVETVDLHASGWQRAATVHRMVEAERRVYAERATHLGDPAHYPVPLTGLLDSAYIMGRMHDFDPEHATPSRSISAGKPPDGPEQTTHFSIVDPEGNAVAITTTLNGSYGSAVVVRGAGFVLNNEMDDFSAKPGEPNMYGLVGDEANAIAPGKRMLSSMCPTVITCGDALYMVVGTPGGSTIPTSIFQVILNVHVHGMSMQEAVSAPRFHHQWLPDVIQMEPGAIAPADSMSLLRMGHSLRLREPYGNVDAVLVLPNGHLEGGADPRGDDNAQGF